MAYKLLFSSDAQKDLKLLRKHAPDSLPKLAKLLEEIIDHPRTGTGQIELLKGYDGNVYSRRITQKHRIVYRIYEDTIEVLVLSAYGHYDD